ncbi:hypothetical protein NDU88_002283 [Pleurodeles waltl]|uniref:Secreted protein n=1 Tax=Pleurodeles waltl TaxID=8319 RepID=A0AAV7KYI0_PLEWA|nr:hypothetical protein NDU88_002283 [Pleurodeles waltl]
MLRIGAPSLACFTQAALLALPLFPRRRIQATPLCVRHSYSVARHHCAAPAAFLLSSGFCGGHIRESTTPHKAAPSLCCTQEPEAVLARCYNGAARRVLQDCLTMVFVDV